MKQNVSSSDSFGSIDEEVLKELKNVPMVLATQDEMDMVDVFRGLRTRFKVQHLTDISLNMPAVAVVVVSRTKI